MLARGDGTSRQLYQAGHLPGAIPLDWHLDLNETHQGVRDLLLTPERFAQVMAQAGIGDETFVVAYADTDQSGAARLWWALRYYGHENVAVLNGGFTKWIAEGRLLTTLIPRVREAHFTPRPQPGWLAVKDEILAALSTPTSGVRLLDTRPLEQYLGLANPSCIEVGATVEIIGTVEAGYESHKWPIEPGVAIQLAKLVSRRALDIRQVQLPYVLENIVRHAQHLLRADSASLHFLHESRQHRYIYEVCAGKVGRRFLATHPPREDGLGRQAIRDKTPKFIPDPSQGHRDLELRNFNPTVYAEGVIAMAAFPLLVGKKEGVLYVHFRR